MLRPFFYFVTQIHVRMAEWSKAPDSRINPCSLIRNKLENSGPRMRAWVQIPLLTNIFFPFEFASVNIRNTIVGELYGV